MAFYWSSKGYIPKVVLHCWQDGVLLILRSKPKLVFSVWQLLIDGYIP